MRSAGGLGVAEEGVQGVLRCRGWCGGGGDAELQRQQRGCCWVQGLERAVLGGAGGQEQSTGR